MKTRVAKFTKIDLYLFKKAAIGFVYPKKSSNLEKNDFSSIITPESKKVHFASTLAAKKV